MEEANLVTATLTNPEEVLANVITIFQDRVRIDVQTSTPGITFGAAWERRERMTYQGQTFNVLCKDDLIASKLAAGRKVDREDVRLLRLSEDPSQND
jgi:hypothetical protein